MSTERANTGYNWIMFMFTEDDVFNKEQYLIEIKTNIKLKKHVEINTQL